MYYFYWCINTPTKENSRGGEDTVNSLLSVRVAVQYRYVTDGGVINRSLDDVIKILKEVHADFLFQGWLTQRPCPEKCSDLPPVEATLCMQRGYSYEHLRDAICRIKRELPNLIFCGGTQAEFLHVEEVPGRDLKDRKNRAWEMSLNPEKWGLTVSRADIQFYWAKRWGFVREDERLSEEELKWRMNIYFPDLTNPEFQDILLSRIYRQIDCGVDAVWIDMLYMQALMLKHISGSWSHPAVQDSLRAANEIVDRIHRYGLESKGKYIYVISWVADVRGNIVEVVPKTNLDAGMVAPDANEIKNRETGEIGEFKEEMWKELVKEVKDKLGIPLFAMIDYGGPGRTDLYVFSQELTFEEAGEFLRLADDFFSKMGIIFIYPVHGGDMGRLGVNVTKLSYGRFNWYDSLAPEFQTYEVIKELATRKVEG